MDPAEARLLRMLPSQQVIDEVTARGDSEIQRFYCNVAVFITGGSGFLGKLLIEKLFRSCKIRKMFLLMRPKKGKDVQQRLTEMFKNPVFEILHQKQPSFLNRIVIVEGDVALPRLGISDEDWCKITEEVTVIFHGAATLRFDEPLQQATLTNVRGTREVLRLGHACKLLRSFVYISTAYTHATDSRIGGDILEQFYPTPVPPDMLIQLAENLQPDKLNDIAPSLMSGWANTYCFTKAVAEETVRTVGAGLPVCIVRPSIVISAYKEPLPGWVDVSSVYGAGGLYLGFIMGIVHVIRSNPSVNIDFVPADFVNNAIIAAGWNNCRRWDNGEEDMRIYTVTSVRNKLTIADCTRIVHKELRELASPKAIWFIYFLHAGSDVTYSILRFLLHDLPAVVVDGACLVLGKRLRLQLIYQKIHKVLTVLTYFNTNAWKFSDENLQNMYNSMSENDKTIYNFDICTISIQDLIVIWSIGLRKYIIKDGLEGTQNGVRKQKLYKIVSVLILLFYLLIFYTIIYFVFIVTGWIL